MPISEAPQIDFLPQPVDSPDLEMQTQVDDLLATLYPKKGFVERRRDIRYPFPYLVHLTPVADDGITPQGTTIVAVGKHLSQRGLGFYHPMPISHRRMIVSMEPPNARRVAFLIDLTWCRFTRQGWYESGGRFLKAVPVP